MMCLSIYDLKYSVTDLNFRFIFWSLNLKLCDRLHMERFNHVQRIILMFHEEQFWAERSVILIKARTKQGCIRILAVACPWSCLKFYTQIYFCQCFYLGVNVRVIVFRSKILGSALILDSWHFCEKSSTENRGLRKRMFTKSVCLSSVSAVHSIA